MPGTRVPAGATSTSSGTPWSSRRTTSAFAASMARGPGAVQPLQCLHQLRVAGRRDPPAHLLDRHALLAHRVREQRQPDVHDRDLLGQHDLGRDSHRSSAPPGGHGVTGPGEQQPLGVVQQLPALRDGRVQRVRVRQALLHHRLDRCG